MSVWKRFVRAVKSIFGGAIASLEDPRLILEQNIREMNDQVPKMNENIATVKANVMMFQREIKKHESELNALTARIKAGIQAGRDDIAQKYALRLEQTRESLARTREQLQYADSAYDKALQVKKAFMREKERKIQEARDALRAHERAQWQARVADALEQFEVAGIDQTHDEMVRRVNEQTARNEARMELALDSVDTESIRIEEAAEDIRAAEIVRQFKLEMGLEESAARAPAPEERTEGEQQAEPTDREKTVGRQRTRSS